MTYVLREVEEGVVVEEVHANLREGIRRGGQTKGR